MQKLLEESGKVNPLYNKNKFIVFYNITKLFFKNDICEINIDITEKMIK